MKLDKIVVENFRQYYGRQLLDFAKDEQRNVTVINGINGTGKTSLFLAINWCLYGRSVENTKIVDNAGELLSKEAISRARPGESMRASVDLSFLHSGDRYLVRRSLVGIKQQDGTVQVDPTEEFTMMRTRWDGQAERVMNPVGTINAILPSNVRTYFLFDGEKIDNFAKPEAADEVRDAIYLVLKLEVLERAHRHLDTAAQEYRKELKRVSSGELFNLIERDESARAERDKSESRKAELVKEIDSARRKIADIDQKLNQQKEAKSLQQQRDLIERDLRIRRSELDSLVSQIRDGVAGAYLFAAQPLVDYALKVLNEKRERGEIPSSIRRQFVQDLIAQMRCICGRDFDDGSEEHRRLLSLMESRLPGSLEDDVLNTSASLSSFAERGTRQNSDLSAAMKRRTELVDIIKNLEAELDDVGRQLKGSPLEQISQLERQRECFLADIDSANIEIGSISERVEKLTKEIDQLESSIAKARKDERRERLLSFKLDLAQKAADAIRKMYQSFADGMRVRIEAKTKEIFKQLVWKGSHFQDVSLGPDFNLEVIDRYALPARPELSAGERQVLSLSFITAMSRVSEEEAPLVMDTPFGRLSSQHRMNITEHLPALADQLVLFVTDEELHDQARRNLEPRIGAEYRLEFNLKTSCTEIVEVPR
jgi:DNA sulfur modification protein DndD